MTREEATRILDEVIPPPEHHTVDLDHLLIAQAWLCIKETLTAEPKPMHWIDTAEGRFKYSVCGKGYDFKHSFCPNCGKKADNPSGVFLKAKMDESTMGQVTPTEGAYEALRHALRADQTWAEYALINEVTE